MCIRDRRRNRNQVEDVARNESVADDSTGVISQKSSGTSSVKEIDESIETFGNERIAQVEDEVDQITTRILGEFKGWSGYTKFQLENGQLWQQSSEGLLIVRMNNPTVIIKKSFFGTYNLNVEGVNSTIKVRRMIVRNSTGPRLSLTRFSAKASGIRVCARKGENTLAPMMMK